MQYPVWCVHCALCNGHPSPRYARCPAVYESALYIIVASSQVAMAKRICSKAKLHARSHIRTCIPSTHEAIADM